MLSNAYFLAKFRFDTAENEPANNLQILQKIANFPNFADPNPQNAGCPDPGRRGGSACREARTGGNHAP